MRSNHVGVCVALLISAISLRAHANVTMTPSDVGNVIVGSTGMVVGSLADTNKNTVDLAVSNVGCTGVGTGTFSLDMTSNIDLNSPVNVTISYMAMTKGMRRCTVTVTKHAGGMFLDTFTIQATGQNPQTISVSSPPAFATVRFNDLAPVHTSSQNIVATNTGDVTLTFTDVVIGGTDAADFSITSGGTTGTILAGNTHTWAVTFDPATAGAKAATMTFTTDDPATPMKVINLSGTGSNAIIGVTSLVDFLIINAGNSSSKDDTITNNGASVKGNLGVTSATIGNIVNTPPSASPSWFTFTSCAMLAGDTCSYVPGLSVATTQLVAIKCSPPSSANAGDNQTATVTFASDTDDASGTPANTTNLSCTAGKSVLTTKSGGAPVANLSYADTQVTAAAPTQAVMITNTGNAAASVTFTITGTEAGNFSITSACGTGAQAACMLAANGGNVSVDIGFAPIVEGGLGATLVVTNNLGVSPSLALAGRGIDRHISVAPMELFPDTFRYPGSSATPTGVAVMNTGDAPLHITGLTVGDAPIWVLDSAQPTDFVIPPQSAMPVNVTFAPISAGKQDAGRLMITSDDRLVPTSMVGLNGYGKDRDVHMGPTSLDIGDTGAGVPTKLSAVHPGQTLTITNMDLMNTFHIRQIVMEGDNVFTVTDLDGNDVNGMELPPNTSKQFDVVFKPPGVGTFRANIALYLDEDPTSQTSIPVDGRAVFVDARGGGGCSTGRGGGTGSLVLVLGALALGRRRRRPRPNLIDRVSASAPMRDSLRPRAPLRGGATIAAALVAALIAWPLAARAEPTRNIELSVFDPLPSTSGSVLQLQTADVGANGAYVATALASFASNPLVLDTGAGLDPVVKNQTMMSIGGAYAFLDRFEAGAHMPFYVQSGDAVQAGTLSVPPASGTARGALTIHAKARVLRTDMLRAGVGLGLKLPTMSDSEFAGADKPSLRALALVTAVIAPRLSLDANVGGVLRAKTQFANIEQKSGLAWGVGATFRVTYSLSATGEVFGDMIPSGYHGMPPEGQTMGPTSALTTIEWLAGARWQASRQLSVGLAVGRGVTSGIGAPDFRSVLTVAFAPSAPAAPSLVHVAPPPPPPIDPSHGDRDYDRIPDAVDKCPDQPEDKDGFEDEDGCPDLDNDKDGVPDDKDRCPNVAEDKDGFEDEDGCPELDNDKDGIPDATDKCPNQPETINGVDDDDGCPDKGDSLIISSPERLELLDPIAFQGTGLAKTSNNVLGQLAATLRARADILRIRITVHVQPTASPEKDQALSDKRATAVREWLVKWGIVESRLEVKGFGGLKPLVSPTTKGAAQINDRIEIIILDLDRGGTKHR
jgi:hypothetical protein